jgi:glycosyltransferase involved in cell wall biosynthesis
MAAGNCVLARDTPSNREVLTECGLYWKSPHELADLLRQVWDDNRRRQEFGALAAARVRATYSWDAVAEKYIELCAQTMA